MKIPVRILFNDSHNNMPGSGTIAQGGPGRFADLFTAHFKDTSAHLISVFFSHNDVDDTIGLRAITAKKQHDYFEIFYPKQRLTSQYLKTYTKKDFLKYLAPWMEQAEKLFDATNPTVVFLNGYGLTNYLLFAVAKKRKIPLCIQHAGIWQKELGMDSGNAFSSSIRKIFTSLEKDLVSERTHHIFLNAFSRDAFLAGHKLSIEDLYASSVIPLPIPAPEKILPFTLKQKSAKKLSIAAVARWDAIKNHGALLRLAEYIKETNAAATVSVVTNPFNGTPSQFRERYVASVNVVEPMNPKKLAAFYRTCDIIILPSQFDVSPTVLMEAVIQGVPVVISNQVGWVSDYNALGLSSLIVSPAASGEELFSAINQIFISPERYMKKMSALQARILKQHLPENIFSTYEKLFTKLSKHHG